MPKNRRAIGGYIWRQNMDQALKSTKALIQVLNAVQAVCEENNMPYRDVLLKQAIKGHQEINSLLLALGGLKEIAGTTPKEKLLKEMLSTLDELRIELMELAEPLDRDKV